MRSNLTDISFQSSHLTAS